MNASTTFYELDSKVTLLGEIEPTTPVQKVIETTKKEVPKTLWKLNKNFVELMVASIGFVAALSWNDFFKSLFEKGGVFESVGNKGYLLTAIMVTFLAFVFTLISTTLYPESKISTKPNPIKTE